VNQTRATGTLATSGSSTAAYTFKVGTGTVSSADDISVSIHSVSATSLSIGSTSVTTVANANAASSAITNAIDDVQTYRSQVGASQNRLEFAAANIATASENTEAARSQLLDLDVAAEMTTFVSKQILVQAGVSMLAQAQRMPQDLLRLFQQ
jgi:flagellin